MLEPNGLPNVNVPALERTLRARWGALPGVYDIAVRLHERRMAVIVSGPSHTAPAGITDAVRVDIGAPQPAVLPVYWRIVPAASPRQLPYAQVKTPNRANEAMWRGESDVQPRATRMINPRTGAVGFDSATKVPDARLASYQFFLPARTPQMPFFSRPFNQRTCKCLNDLYFSQGVILFNVGADEQLTLTGISYDVLNVPVSNQIRFRVRGSGSLLAQWDDIVASTTDGPANQFALSGHDNPMPLNVIIDHDQTLTVEAEALGIYPFAAPPPYATTAQICILMQGYITTLNDARTGAPRPLDLGDINDVAQGNLDIISTMKDPALVDAVLAVVGQAEAEIQDPADPLRGRD